ncbi:DUF488 family protein (plasmid) [Leptospira sp. WS92.C1]
MKIYTSYFANVRNLSENIVPISIARYARHWEGFKYFPLAPDGETLKMPLREYTEKFHSKLSKLNVKNIIEELKAISDESDIALLCYEKPGDFCHRRLVAEWIEKETGMVVPEYQTLLVQKKEETKQPKLF